MEVYVIAVVSSAVVSGATAYVCCRFWWRSVLRIIEQALGDVGAVFNRMLADREEERIFLDDESDIEGEKYSRHNNL